MVNDEEGEDENGAGQWIYAAGEVVGEGAFSLVWRGVQPALGRKVAVKQIRAELANQPEVVRRFETEAQTVAALEHPYIVPLYDYWREPDSAYLVKRYVIGGTLEAEVLAIARRIAGVASDLSQIVKRMVHRQFDVGGGRAAMRAGQEFQALAGHQASVAAFRADPLAAMKQSISEEDS